MGQLLVSDGADFVRALYAAGGQGELLAGGQLLHTVLELTQTNLGTLGVQHTGNGQVQLLGQCAYLVIAALVLLVVAMRKVETRDVHAVLHQLAQNARLIGGRTHSTDDLGFTHKAYPPFYISTLYTLANLSGIILQVRRGRQEENGFRLKKTAQKLFPFCPLIFTQFQLVPCKFCHNPGTTRLTGHRRSTVPAGPICKHGLHVYFLRCLRYNKAMNSPLPLTIQEKHHGKTCISDCARQLRRRSRAGRAPFRRCRHQHTGGHCRASQFQG